MCTSIFKLYFFPFFLSLGFGVGLGYWESLFEAKEFLYFLIGLVINTIFLIFIQQSHSIRLKWFFITTIMLFCGYIASSTGFLQGHMSLGIVASLFQTDHSEVIEFLSNINYKFIGYSVLLLGLTYFYIFKYKTCFKLNFRHKFLYFLLIFNVFNVFLVQTVKATYLYKKEEQELLQEFGQKIDWKVNRVNPKYKNQIFIIGESVHRDYLSLYGFKEKTTPFLDRMPLTIVDQYISTAPNTVTSLSRTLAMVDQKNDDINIAMNVVSLAKQAKYNTVWLSNQGFMGKNDTPISKIAIHADQQVYLKHGSYQSKNIDDFELIPLLEESLQKNSHQNNVIFIHMMGSHPKACDRLFGTAKIYGNYPETINCYLSSINKLDSFIEQSYKVLKKQNKSFSISYFSDHGMTVTDDSYYVDNDTKSNYRVPFFQLTSDAKRKHYLYKTVSAYDFLNIYASILGIETPYLQSSRSLEKIRNNRDVQVFNWDKYLKYNELRE